MRGTWLANEKKYQWEFGEYVKLNENQSSQGACEPAAVQLPDGNILISLRACGDRDNKIFPSLKYQVISEDGGKTFSTPEVLKYDDGTTVWSPSSYHNIIKHSTGRYFWIGNILDEPAYSSEPRYPLNIAEYNPEKLCIIKNSVFEIDTKPDNFKEWRRYTNFGCYEDRKTKEIVLTLPEQAKISKKDFTSDCYIYKITI